MHRSPRVRGERADDALHEPALLEALAERVRRNPRAAVAQHNSLLRRLTVDPVREPLGPGADGCAFHRDDERDLRSCLRVASLSDRALDVRLRELPRVDLEPEAVDDDGERLRERLLDDLLGTLRSTEPDADAGDANTTRKRDDALRRRLLTRRQTRAPPHARDGRRLRSGVR